MSFNHGKSLPTVYIPALLLMLVCLFTSDSTGQVTPAPTKKNVTVPQDQTSANEDFELNITQDRITETNFTRSTKVELSNENRGGLRLEVGVAVRAQSIDVILRGIVGRVRFRASLEPLRRRFEQTKNTESLPPKP